MAYMDPMGYNPLFFSSNNRISESSERFVQMKGAADPHDKRGLVVKRIRPCHCARSDVPNIFMVLSWFLSNTNVHSRPQIDGKVNSYLFYGDLLFLLFGDDFKYI